MPTRTFRLRLDAALLWWNWHGEAIGHIVSIACMIGGTLAFIHYAQAALDKLQ